MTSRRHILIGAGALAVAGGGAAYFGLRQMGSMDEYNASVAATRSALSASPDVVTRFGYGAALPFSARRPVDAVLA